MEIIWGKKREKDDDLTTKEQLLLMKSRITRVESEILDVITAVDIIRNKVLRKIQSKKSSENEEETAETWAGIPKTAKY